MASKIFLKMEYILPRVHFPLCMGAFRVIRRVASSFATPGEGAKQEKTEKPIE